MGRSAFGELLETRCRELDIASQAELGRLLAARGISVSANTLSSWHTGGKRPRAGHLGALCDVLQIHGPSRDRAYRLAQELDLAADDDSEPAPVVAS